MRRPFDAKRYKRLLEGLEMTVLKLSDIVAGNRVFRIDAQYFGKTALAMEAAIERGQWSFLKDVADGVASFGAYALTNQFTYTDQGIPFLRCQNIRNGFVDFYDALHIDEAANKLLEKSAVRPGMVLFTMSGSVGNAATALTEWKYPVNSNQDIAKITPKAELDPHYLSAFLNSRYGRAQTERLPVGSVQQHIFLWMIERLKIARLDSGIESKIAELVTLAYDSERTAKSLVESAEASLTIALGLSDWRPPQSLTYTRCASQALDAGRLDAEYFHPAKKAALDLLAGLPGRAVGEMFRSVRDLWNPRDFHGSRLIRNYDLTHALNPFLDDSVELTDVSAVFSAKKRIERGDLVVSRLRSYLREIAVVVGNDPLQVASTEFIVLRPGSSGLKVEALLFYLRSLLPQLIFRWSQDGSNHPRFNEKELLNLRVPNVVLEIQDSLAGSFRAAIEQRRRSRELLTTAQRAVEVAIEQGEAAALAHLAHHGIAG